MDNREVLVDTSIIIDHLRKKIKSQSILYGLVKSYTLYLSTISLFELYAGANTARKMSDIENILVAFDTLLFSDSIARKSAEIYLSLKKENKLMEIRDLFIAATAIVYEMPIITLNKNTLREFKNWKS